MEQMEEDPDLGGLRDPLCTWHRAKLLLAYSISCLPYFALIYAQLLNSKEKKQTCPISYYTTVRGLGARQEDGICRFQTPLAQNPALPLPRKVLFVPDNTSVLRTGLSGCHTQGVLPSMGTVQTPLFSHLPQSLPSTAWGVALPRKSHVPPGKVIRSNTRMADWHSPAMGASLQAWDAQVRPAVTGLKMGQVLTPRGFSFTAMLMDPPANQRTAASKFLVWKSWKFIK